MLRTKLPLSWITAPRVTILTKRQESTVMHSSEEHLETILCRLCELITRWDPDRRELENLPDQPEMLDLMLMKNLGLSKVNTSLICYIPTSLVQVGWCTLKLAENHSVILLRHVTNDRVNTSSEFRHCGLFYKFSGFEYHNWSIESG